MLFWLQYVLWPHREVRLLAGGLGFKVFLIDLAIVTAVVLSALGGSSAAFFDFLLLLPLDWEEGQCPKVQYIKYYAPW